MRPKPLAERFWSFVAKSDGCWLWTGGKTVGGYGVVRVSIPRRLSEGAHRVSWRLHFGQIPDGLYVCHRCDVRACVRPDHLFLGTASDNMSDMTRKGRNKKARICPSDVLAIKRALASGETQARIAERYGLLDAAVSKINTGRTWKSINQAERGGS